MLAGRLGIEPRLPTTTPHSARCSATMMDTSAFSRNPYAQTLKKLQEVPHLSLDAVQALIRRKIGQMTAKDTDQLRHGAWITAHEGGCEGRAPRACVAHLWSVTPSPMLTMLGDARVGIVRSVPNVRAPQGWYHTANVQAAAPHQFRCAP